MTDTGYIFYINLNINGTKQDIIHELNHILQYYKVDIKNLDRNFSNSDATKLFIFANSGKTSNNLLIKFNYLCSMLYYSDNQEINSYITEIYIKIKNLNYNKKIKNEVFEHFIKNNYVYNIYEKLNNYDIFNEL